MTELSPAEVNAIWQQACAALQLQLSPAVFQTWIVSNPLTRLRYDEEQNLIGTLTCPTAFHATNIQKNLQPNISQALSDIIGQPPRLEFEVGDPQRAAARVITNEPQAIGVTLAMSPSTESHTPFPHSQHQVQPSYNSPNAIPHNYQATPPPTVQPSYSPSFSPPPTVSRQNSESSPRVEDLFSQNTIQANTMDRALVTARNAGLRLDYTFATFAVSSTNEMAHAAASAVSNNPGGAYNPLFLYGGVGVGKTHLMHAIGNNIIKNNPDTKILYSTGEEFTNEIVSAIQNKKGLRFKDKFRSAQILLVDDIQFIAGKNTVQEEFFHTFNALTKMGHQIVLTSDRPPHEINLLEDRLRSRFEAGLMIDIQQPTFELRTAILLIKAAAVNLEIPMNHAQTIASKVDSARKIEGIIKSIRSEVELKHRIIDEALIDDVLRSETEKKRPQLKVSPSDVLRAVANHYHVKQSALKGQRRVANLVRARHVAMYLLKEELHLPLTEIGRWFSNRDHTSALHAIRKIDHEMTMDDMLQRDISALRMSLAAVSR